jgi:cytochrome c-type biogenesis protein CcmH
MIQKVEEKTKTDPNNVEAWVILGKTYAAVGHWPEALHAYEKAIKLQPDVPAIMTGYAEALAISRPCAERQADRTGSASAGKRSR